MSRRIPPGWAPAVYGALSLALYLALWLLPVAGAVASLFCPVPLVILYHRFGKALGRRGVVTALVGALALYLALPQAPAYYFVYFAAMAVMLGEAAEKGLPDDWSIGLASLASLLALAMVLVATGFFSSQSLMDAWEGYWRHELDVVLQMYGQMGLDPKEAQSLRQTVLETGRQLIKAGPGMVAAGSLLTAWANLLMARRILIRVTPEMAERNSGWTRWGAPAQLIWVFIACCLLMIVGDGWWFWLGVNLIIVLEVIYFFQGLAIMAYWFEWKNAPRFLRMGIYALVALEFFLALLVAAAGLFDMWFNFRKLNVQKSA